jgi:hypothetical protein
MVAIAVLIAGLAAAPISASATGPAIQAPVVPVSVVEMTTGGFWRTSEDRGRYRVIVETQGWEHLGSRVFLQWIAERPNERKLVVVASLLLSELPDNATVAPPRLIGTKSGTMLHVEPGGGPTEKSRTFVFSLGEPGKYTLKR